MARVSIDEMILKDTADAIRAKGGDDELMSPTSFASAINAIPTMEVTIDKTLTQEDQAAEAKATGDAIAAEAAARAEADTALQQSIAAETAARTSAVSAEIANRENGDTLLQSQIDQIVAPSGEAPSAAEVENARIDVDGVTHTTLGEAIRGQVESRLRFGSVISANTSLDDLNDGIHTLTNGIYDTGPENVRLSGMIIQVTFGNGVKIQHIFNDATAQRKQFSRYFSLGSWKSWVQAGAAMADLNTLETELNALDSEKLGYGGILNPGDSLNNIDDGVWDVPYGDYETGPGDVLSGFLTQISYANGVKVQYMRNTGRANQFEWSRLFIGGNWRDWSRCNTTAADLANVEFNRGPVGVFKSGTNLYIRSRTTEESDLCFKCGYPYQGYNYIFNFVEARMIPKDTTIANTITAYNAASMIKPCLDDTPAILYGGSDRALGANHGCNAFTKLICNHDLTEANIGETWTDNNGNECTIVQVFNDCLIVGKVADDWLQVLTPDTITRNGTTIAITDSSAIQLRRSAIRKNLALEDESHREITNGWAKNVVITESYWITDPVDVITYLQSNVGACNNASYYSDEIPTDSCIGRLENIYTFTAGGRCRIVSTFKSNNSFRWSRVHVALARYFEDTCYGAVPGSNLPTLTDVRGTARFVTFSGTAPYDYFIANETVTGDGWFVSYLPNAGIMDNSARTQQYCARYRIDAMKLYPEMFSEYPVSPGDNLIMVAGYGYTPLNSGIMFSAIDMGDFTACAIFANTSTNGLVHLPLDLQNRRIMAKDTTIKGDYTTTSVEVELTAGSVAHFLLG